MEGHYAAKERERLETENKRLREALEIALEYHDCGYGDGKGCRNCDLYKEALSKTTPHESQGSITRWAKATFGKAPSIAHIFDRAEEEFYELKIAIANNEPSEKIAEEIADVRIVLCQISERLGYNEQAAVDAKMKINRSRKWETDGNGSGQHID